LVTAAADGPKPVALWSVSGRLVGELGHALWAAKDVSSLAASSDADEVGGRGLRGERPALWADAGPRQRRRSMVGLQSFRLRAALNPEAGKDGDVDGGPAAATASADGDAAGRGDSGGSGGGDDGDGGEGDGVGDRDGFGPSGQLALTVVDVHVEPPPHAAPGRALLRPASRDAAAQLGHGAADAMHTHTPRPPAAPRPADAATGRELPGGDVRGGEARGVLGDVLLVVRLEGVAAGPGHKEISLHFRPGKERAPGAEGGRGFGTARKSLRAAEVVAAQARGPGPGHGGPQTLLYLVRSPDIVVAVEVHCRRASGSPRAAPAEPARFRASEERYLAGTARVSIATLLAGQPAAERWLPLARADGTVPAQPGRLLLRAEFAPVQGLDQSHVPRLLREALRRPPRSREGGGGSLQLLRAAEPASVGLLGSGGLAAAQWATLDFRQVARPC
jgi:hypothetical protein